MRTGSANDVARPLAYALSCRYDDPCPPTGHAKEPVVSVRETPPTSSAPRSLVSSRLPRWVLWSLGAALLVGGACLAWAVAVEPVAPVQGFEIINIYPHDAKAFTQGLAFDDKGQLYEGTGLYGQSTLRKVDLKTGQPDPATIFTLEEQYFGEGIAVVGDSIVQLTWRNEAAFVFDRQSLKFLRRFRYRGEGWGLTYDGTSLIMSDGTSRLKFIDPKTFRTGQILRVMDGKREVSHLNELEYVEGEIYANVWHTDRIARISPKTGKVLGWIDLAGLLKPNEIGHEEAVLNGIAYDAKNKKLYVTGKNWPKLFEIRVAP
jgi:glutamine cyclotransferase